MPPALSPASRKARTSAGWVQLHPGSYMAFTEAPLERHPPVGPLWNADPRPFVWKKAAEESLNSLSRHISRMRVTSFIASLISQSPAMGR